MYDASRFLPCEPRVRATTEDEEEEVGDCSGGGSGVCGVCVGCGSGCCCNVVKVGDDNEEKDADIIHVNNADLKM